MAIGTICSDFGAQGGKKKSVTASILNKFSCSIWSDGNLASCVLEHSLFGLNLHQGISKSVSGYLQWAASMAESVSPILGTASLVYWVSASQPASLPSTHRSLGSCESAPHEEPEGNAPLSLALGSCGSLILSNSGSCCLAVTGKSKTAHKPW